MIRKDVMTAIVCKLTIGLRKCRPPAARVKNTSTKSRDLVEHRCAVWRKQVPTLIRISLSVGW